MTPVLHRLLAAARSAGVRISAAEAMDGFRAATAIGLDDRQALKDALTVTLAKSAAEQALFADCFDRYFRRDLIDIGDIHAPGGTGLVRMLAEGDRAALTQALEAAGEAVEVSGISFFTATNLYTRRMMEQMGLAELDAAIAADPGLAPARAALQAEVRFYVERQLALFSKGRNRAWRERRLVATRLGSIDRHELARMRVIVRAMARRLATRLARRRRRAVRGQLDLRRTFRRNMPHDAVPFRTVWRRRPIDRPRVLALCDVSGSMAQISRFMLLFLHVLADVLPDIRCFAFSGELEEVTALLDDDEAEAAEAVLARIGGGSTNYGRSLEDFCRLAMTRLDRKTSVIILGDARGNNTPPRLDLMQQIFSRAGRVVWLNPEPESFWGTGDSDMPRYKPFCHQAETCSTIAHLERALATMLDAGS